MTAFQNISWKIIIVVHAVDAPPKSALPGLSTRSQLLECWLLRAQKCLFLQGTAYIQREPLDLALAGRLSFASGDRLQPMTYEHLAPLLLWRHLWSRAPYEMKWKLGFG